MIKRIAQAWGFAAILLLPGYVDLTSTLGDERMRVPWPLTRLVLAQLVDLAIVGVVFACHAGRPPRLEGLAANPVVRSCIASALSCSSAISGFFRLEFRTPALPSSPSRGLLFSALLILRAPQYRDKTLCSRQRRAHRRCGVCIRHDRSTGKRCLWRPGIQAFSGSNSRPVRANRPRLIWIIFDELAYKPVFEARDPSLNLPNFDRLRLQSTVYTDVTPIGYHTNLGCAQFALGPHRNQLYLHYEKSINRSHRRRSSLGAF